MIELKRIKLGELSNEAHFEYQTQFYEHVKRFTSKTLNIEDLFKSFESLYKKENEALLFIRSSNIIKKRNQVDKDRSSTLKGLFGMIRIQMNHVTEERKASALKLKPLLDLYNRGSMKAMNEETAAIHKIIQELRSDVYQLDAAYIGLGEWIDKLEEHNEEFRKLTHEYHEEQASRPTARMKEVRKDIDLIYRSIVKRMEASIILNGEKNFLEFVPLMNETIQMYKTMMSQEKAQRKIKKDKKEAKISNEALKQNLIGVITQK